MYEYAQKKKQENRFLKENQVSSESLAIYMEKECIHGSAMIPMLYKRKWEKGKKENPSKLQGISLFHLL